MIVIKQINGDYAHDSFLFIRPENVMAFGSQIKELMLLTISGG